MTTIIIHAFLALLAIPLGAYILFNKKGTAKHKFLGKIWVVFLIIVSATAIFIQEINSGEYSLIHLLIPFTLLSLIHSIRSIKKYKMTRKIKYKYAHMYSMIGVYIGALILAGALTLMPGRIVHELLF